MKTQQENSRFTVSKLSQPNRYSLALLFLTWGFFTLLYYFGETVDFFGWTAIRWDFFYSVHDLHRALFLVPIVYSGYIFGVKATVTISIITAMVFLPRAILISPYPDPLLRMLTFMAIAALLGYLTARSRTEYLMRINLQKRFVMERDRMLLILEGMADGVSIVGPDYRIRFMNQRLINDFGEGVGESCHKIFHGEENPCLDSCRLNDVINGAVTRWEYRLPDGRKWEVNASPYRDTDGIVCVLTIFRKITPAKD